GSLEDLPTVPRHAVEDLVRYTSDGDRMTLTLALSYGGRQDIVEAARSLAVRARAGLVLPEDIDETFFHKQMTTHDLPQVDLLIRTGGETRLSDFLLYEAAYAELLFLPIMWPDFRPETLLKAVESYAHKERRFGMISEQVQGMLPIQAFDPVDRIQN
ncbi:MAG TPA: polyprenyl diphosphate synthase, partial [Polyangiaceae bacterium]|nr:polyprenyl diphosphate synthase [Polyangiaceae bacterium]